MKLAPLLRPFFEDFVSEAHLHGVAERVMKSPYGC